MKQMFLQYASVRQLMFNDRDTMMPL